MASELQVNTITEATSGSGITFAKDIIPATPLSHRNLIINGDFQVWQRATSATSYNAFASADRWKHLTAGQVEKTTDNSANRNHVLKFTTSNSQTVNYIRQKVEAPADYMGNTLTLSFWMKTSEVLTTRVDFWLSNASGTYVINGFHNGSSTGSGNNYLALAENTSTSWKRHTVQVYIPNYTPKTDNTDNLEVNIGVADGTTTGKEVYIDQVQLELGTVATPFEHRSYAEELTRCQRYFVARTNISSVTQLIAYGMNFSASEIDVEVEFAVPMRANPTIVQTSGTNYFNAFDGGNTFFDNFTNVQHQAPYSQNVQRVNMYKGSLSGLTVGRVSKVSLTTTGSAAGIFAFTAEL